MMDLYQRLLCVDPESQWTVEEVESPTGGESHFRKYLGQLLETLGEAVGADVGYAAISALQSGQFVPFVAYRQALEPIPPTPTYGGCGWVVDRLGTLGPFAASTEGDHTERDADMASAGQRLLIKLIGHGELFGFICLDKRKGDRFEDARIAMLRTAAPLITRLVAEENFSMRVRQIAGPIAVVPSDGELPQLYRAIVDQTARAFACDGCVLRILDAEFGLLTPVAHSGDPPSDLIKDRSPGDGICGRVLVDERHSWAVGMHGFDNTNLGMCVPDSDLARIRQAGIQSFIVMRLESESADEADGRRIGTLSYFFRRPHRFSWREVSLFRTFCRLVAGMIALHRQNAKLRESYQSLRLQSASMTRVEIVSLIAHDLFHKSFNTCHAIEEYIDKCRKTLNSRVEPRSHVHLEEDAACAMEAARTVQTALQQLRSLQSRGTEEFEKESEFDLRDVFTEIEDSLAGALSRNKLLVRRDFLDKLPVYGARTALTHVFFNLVINSIDAARTRATRRPMAIHVSAKVDESGTDHRLVVQYWDEGPGISRTAFKHPNEIFEIGRSTKPDGAGTGLPVARVLLARYFRGNLALVDPAKALFRVTIPLNRHRCGA